MERFPHPSKEWFVPLSNRREISHKMTRKFSVDAKGKIIKETVIVKKTSNGIGRLSPEYGQRKV